MTDRRLYCLGVQALLADRDREHDPQRWLPSLCLADLSPFLMARILALHDLLDQHNLHTVTQRVTDVTWYYPRTGYYHPAAESLLHVGETSIWFSGWVPPFSAPCFVSSPIPLQEALGPDHPAHTLDLTALRTAETGGLIRELALLDAEETRTYERLDTLDALHEQLLAVDASTAERSNTDLIAYAAALSADVAHLQQRLDELALQTRTLTKELLRKALGLRLGDWVIWISPRQRRVQLCVEDVSYYGGHLLLNGPRITQRGLVGKRTESLRIPVEAPV